MSDDKRLGRPVRLADLSSSAAIPVPCRDCGKQVQLSGFAVDVAKMASEVLMNRGEPPLEYGELTRCDSCGETWRLKQLNTALRISNEVVRIIREVKAGRDLNEAQLDWLRRNGYGPTAEGMEAVMLRRREGASGNGPRRGRDDQ
jgi:hypothetical protein